MRKGYGSVKAAIHFYKGKIPLKERTDDSEKQPQSRTGELHRARRRSGFFQEAKGVAETVRSQAEIDLLSANKMVKELEKKIEESNSRAKSYIEDMEKILKEEVRRDHAIALKGVEDPRYNEVMEELEKGKHELSKLKVEMASVLEEKRRAEKESENLDGKTRYYMNLVEVLSNEVDKCNEEHMLVEFAQLEAAKEKKAVELQRQDASQQHAARMVETRKKINNLIKEKRRREELQRLLAITSSEANVLENELKELREMDNWTQKVQPDYPALLKSTTEELAYAKKKLDSEEAESIRLMESMDAFRNEIKAVKEEMSGYKKKGEKIGLNIQNLNSELLRRKAKVEETSASRNKAELIVSNLSTTIEMYTTEAETFKNERIITMEKTSAYKAEAEKIASEIDLAEEKFQAALEELKSVRSSEAEALQNLKSITQETVKNRASASLHSSTITISAFEYEYLTGSAERAVDIANKKIAAAKAWVGALRASEKEMLMKAESGQGRKELSEKEEQQVRTDHLVPANNNFEPRLENPKYNLGNMEDSDNQLRLPRKSISGNMKVKPARRPSWQKVESPAVRTRSPSFSIKRRTKVMPNLVKFLYGKNVQKNVQAT